MKVTSYQMFNDGVRAFLSNGSHINIYFSHDSGKVLFRFKIGTMANIKHAGVYIGHDSNGTQYYIHNHYQLGAPQLVTAAEFTHGMPTYIYTERCVNPWNTVVRNAFDHVLTQEPFKPLSYNCQTMTNSACNNQRKSADAEKLVGGIAATLAISLLLGAIFSD